MSLWVTALRVPAIRPVGPQLAEALPDHDSVRHGGFRAKFAELGPDLVVPRPHSRPVSTPDDCLALPRMSSEDAKKRHRP
jgi:hypothetical protein